GGGEGTAVLVQGELELLDDVVGHLDVDLAGELDEPRRDAELPSLPRQVEGIERDAVAAPARARIEAHEAERLGRGGVEDLPDVDAHAVEDHLELVRERDVDRPEDVLDELRRLGGPGVARADRPLDHGVVDGLGEVAAELVDPADDLRNRSGRERRIARILALGRERQEELLAALESRLLEEAADE